MKNEHKNDLIWSLDEDSVVQQSKPEEFVESTRADPGPLEQISQNLTNRQFSSTILIHTFLWIEFSTLRQKTELFSL